MKKRKSFFKRHIIAIGFVVLVAIYAFTTTAMKEIKLQGMESEGKAYIEQIKALENELKVEQKKYERMDTSEFIEAMVREKLKMVRPDEIYFQTTYDIDEEKDENN